MTTPTPLIRDVFSHLRAQVSAERAGRLFWLAADDPEAFLVEVISAIEAGDVDLPASLRRGLEEQLTRIRARVSDKYLTQGRASAHPLMVDNDPVVESQRRIDAVAERVRSRLPERTEQRRPPSM